jgi:murein DD-endopeptidase MepM/ murein hydrolase activator NlpD
VIDRQRVGALLLAGLTLALAAPLVSPSATAERASAASGTPLGSVSVRLSRLAAVIVRNVKPQPRFPIRGAFNWGQGAARFGAGRGGRAHAGQDVFARHGTPLVAVRDSVVLATGNDGGRGNYVALYYRPSRRTYVYFHMARPAPVRVGRRVRAGDRVGEVGCTGSCWGEHLHFEVRRGRGMDGAAMDPAPLLRRLARADRVPATLPPGAS